MSVISGRRKEATAVVRLKKGSGLITVNKKSLDDYFGRDVAKMIVRQPLVLTKQDNSYDIKSKYHQNQEYQKHKSQQFLRHQFLE